MRECDRACLCAYICVRACGSVYVRAFMWVRPCVRVRV